MVTLTEDLLIDAGGWQVLREARALHGAGKVRSASYEPPMLLGLVAGGKTDFRCGLRITSRSNIENLCSCPESRRDGRICTHSIAAALEILKPTATAAAAPKPESPASQPPANSGRRQMFQPDSGGTEISLTVILPPKLAASWASESLQCVVEAAVAGQTKPFGSLEPKTNWACSAQDARFLDAFLALSEGKPASMRMLSREQCAALLKSLVGHPRVFFGKTQEVHISEEGLRPALILKKDAGGNLIVKCQPIPSLLLSKSEAWSLDGQTLSPLAPGLPAAYFPVLSAPVTIPAAAAENFLQRELPVLAGFFECQLEGIALNVAELPPPPPQTVHLKLEGSLNFLAATFTGPAAQKLREWGFAGPDAKGEMALQGERGILAFFASGLPRLQREWQVEIGERFQHVTRNVERIQPSMEIRSSGEQWFDLACQFSTGDGALFSNADIARLLQSDQSHFKRPNGRITVFDPDLLDDFSQLLRDGNPEQRSPGLFRLQKNQAGALQGFADETGLQMAGVPPDWAVASRQLDALQPIPLGSLDAVLRAYQKQGVYWLNFLAQNGFGGILADEMGLGKTLQTLAFLTALKTPGPVLIVCPSSLIFNWSAEARRWTPDLPVLVLEGARRSESFARIAESRIVLTSYPLLRLDVEKHRNINYAAVFLDEAQQIKNPDSQNAKAACALRARHRFVLTGTPVENSVRDLWSLLHFAMPGYLGSRTDFKERYETPISSNGGGAEQKRLRRRVAPFLLRRTKKVVATELPDKIEQVAWCELTAAQQEMYQSLADATRRQMSELSSARDQKKSRMVMLTALLRLRQVACDLRLLSLPDPPPADAASGKLAMLEELLEEARDGGHRVLVFSQFVTMLGLIRKRLEELDVAFCYLDGQSKDRAEQVQKFQTGEVPVFLISLKAGGTGLNLTAADTVIHFDPWWNPAVEAQATDRAHRIGQKKVVTSYKLVARGTVEEKIINLQAKKKSLIAATLESEEPMMDGLTMQEIESLLE